MCINNLQTVFYPTKGTGKFIDVKCTFTWTREQVIRQGLFQNNITEPTLTNLKLLVYISTRVSFDPGGKRLVFSYLEVRSFAFLAPMLCTPTGNVDGKELSIEHNGGQEPVIPLDPLGFHVGTRLLMLSQDFICSITENAKKAAQAPRTMRNTFGQEVRISLSKNRISLQAVCRPPKIR